MVSGSLQAKRTNDTAFLPLRNQSCSSTAPQKLSKPQNAPLKELCSETVGQSLFQERHAKKHQSFKGPGDKAHTNRARTPKISSGPKSLVGPVRKSTLERRSSGYSIASTTIRAPLGREHPVEFIDKLKVKGFSQGTPLSDVTCRMRLRRLHSVSRIHRGFLYLENGRSRA
ncbi:hypothetical protein N7468_008946 [Penicillium chermesinum]|uniref:Uncharacterized protein n=1 Tax=Penicillium chermesinum TaxID=63820 RepID=A0A9W9NH12_9EURO|nr:uncharacterized protein N7468_008946 [Penicillium chermesinum]KAJ5219742.1 hypothetical protein N7468_008946 [Penicillium chermesinum]